MRSSNEDYFLSTSEKVNSLLANAIDELSKRIPFINMNNVVLQPINEILTGGYSENSALEYFLGVDNAQLDINSRKSDLWKRVKSRIAYAWKNRNAGKKQRFRKKKNSNVKNDKYEKFEKETYGITSLTKDLQTEIAHYLSETSIVYMEGNKLIIVGKDDFGANTQIIIHIVFYDGNKFNYYINRKKIVSIDINKRIEALNEKIEDVGECFCDILKIFNSLYYNLTKAVPNQIFMESLLYNCPDVLFSDDYYNSFVKIINFLTMSDIKNFKSIANPNKTIFTDELCGNCAMSYKRFMNKLIDLKES